MYSEAGKFTKINTPIQKRYNPINELFNKCRCSLKRQYLKANKYKAAIKGQTILVTVNTRPCHKIILNDTLINKIKKVIELTDKNKKLELCWLEEEKFISL